MRRRLAVLIATLLLGVYLIALGLSSKMGAERMNMDRAAREPAYRNARTLR